MAGKSQLNFYDLLNWASCCTWFGDVILGINGVGG